MRTLELIVLQFLVIVILPNNGIGTSELPAVGAKRVLCRAGNCSVASTTGTPGAVAVLFERDRTTHVGSRSLVSRQAAIPAADILQLSRRLRI